jgi:hypothetical protein
MYQKKILLKPSSTINYHMENVKNINVVVILSCYLCIILLRWPLSYLSLVQLLIFDIVRLNTFNRGLNSFGTPHLCKWISIVFVSFVC